MQAFVGIHGTEFTDGTSPIRLRGYALGNWLNLEHFMIGLPGTDAQMHQAVARAYGPQRAAEFWERYLTCYIDDSDIAWVRSLGCNSVRVPFNYRLFESDQEPFHYRDEGFAHIDRLLTLCERHGLYAILDLHSAPGGQNPDWHSDNATGECLFWQYTQFQDRAIALWKHVAARYRDNRVVAAYDLLNEPAMYGPAGDTVARFHERLVRDLRTVDQNHVFILEGDMYAHLFDHFPTLDDPLVAYSCHFYPFFNLQNFREGNMAQRLDQAVAGEKWTEQVFQRLGRPLWCGETGVPLNHGDVALHGRLHAATLGALDRAGISWCVWTYKDARSMGSVRPKQESPWMRLSEQVCGSWRFWEEFMRFEKSVELVQQTLGTTVDGQLKRKLDFRLMADHQYVLSERMAQILQEVPFTQAMGSLESWRFEQCERCEALAGAVRDSCRARAM